MFITSRTVPNKRSAVMNLLFFYHLNVMLKNLGKLHLRCAGPQEIQALETKGWPLHATFRACACRLWSEATDFCPRLHAGAALHWGPGLAFTGTLPFGKDYYFWWLGTILKFEEVDGLLWREPNTNAWACKALTWHAMSTWYGKGNWKDTGTPSLWRPGGGEKLARLAAKGTGFMWTASGIAAMAAGPTFGPTAKHLGFQKQAFWRMRQNKSVHVFSLYAKLCTRPSMFATNSCILNHIKTMAIVICLIRPLSPFNVAKQ